MDEDVLAEAFYGKMCSLARPGKIQQDQLPLIKKFVSSMKHFKN
ncbi:MAG: hypothetical protein ABR595_10825 [Psychroflexus sp.]